MTDEEFERLYGRKPVRPGTQTRVKVYWGRVFIALLVLIMIIIGIVQLIRSIYRHFHKEEPAATVVSVADSSEADSEPDTAPSETDSSSEPEEPKGWQFKVCIDPGHGGEDGGACKTDAEGNVLRKESDDTLRISLAIRDYLEEQGVQVVMTRETDILLNQDISTDLDYRCTIANDALSDFFVSIHRDSVANDASGFECWVHNKKPEMDTLLAQNIMAALQGVGISQNRGIGFGYTNVPTDNYHVNGDTVCPSVLCEMGFITSDIDNQLIDDHYKEYAKAIGDALIQTAQELNVVDATGKRILNEQLISGSKLYYPLESYYSATNPYRVNPTN
ncbi:MAG: N-acetylmuramoyl-L-alanine amidase [Ruminococcus sp.]|nr:N-acetylmuramoyl-L-alanine amidase [Ruminococcus sp.]